MGSMPRRMTLPTQAGRSDPIYRPAMEPARDPAHSAAFILIHGLGDTAEGMENIVDQFQAANKLPYMNWIIPNATEHREAMTTAWYTPRQFSPFPPGRPEMEPEEDDEIGLLKSAAYIESLIDACVNRGIPPNRIVLGGFSQGCSLSLLTDLISKKYGGRLAGVVGLMGYLPWAQGRQIEDMRAHVGHPPNVGNVPVFLARGLSDRMVPKRIHNQSIKKMSELGFTSVEIHEYEGLGHTLSGPVLRDMCTFLQQNVPRLED